jgi:hypothetical protein
MDSPLGFGSSWVVTREDDGRGKLGQWAVRWGRPGREMGWKWIEEMGCARGRQSRLQERKRGVDRKERIGLKV